ncbi:DDE transposase family protein [Oculatella sp. LEGE 06141]|nr:DDE transposase family protein [Oculatella sp. LEGE 06141]MBE9177983.1 DDE transposase family protein [Oculatella sp. LEGE 06141]
MSTEVWYIVKQDDGHCQVVSKSQIDSSTAQSEPSEQWGPFASQGEAIARRVGLIRAGKCQPI